MTDPDTGTPGADGTQPEGSDGPNLPPPAFPPGTRRHQMRRREQRAAQEGMDEAFISPDEPMPQRDGLDKAFISPDEPLPNRSSGEGEGAEEDAAGQTSDEAFISPDDPIPQRKPVQGATATAEEVTVTGIGSDAHLGPEEMRAAGDPHVMELVEKVGKLAQALRQKGEAGLRADPDMDRFEATLRSYCVGYLAGRRAEDGS